MRKLLAFVGPVALVLLFPLMVLAQPASIPDPSADTMGFIQLLWDAVMHKRWGGVVALAVIGIVALLRMRIVTKKVPFLGTDRGGVILTFVVALAGGLAVTLIAGQPLDAEVVFTAVKLAFLAMGGFVGVKKLIKPSDVEVSPDAGEARR